MTTSDALWGLGLVTSLAGLFALAKGGGPRMILLDIHKASIMAKTPEHLPESVLLEALTLAEFIYGGGKDGADGRRRIVIEALDHLAGGFDEHGNNRHVAIQWNDQPATT